MNASEHLAVGVACWIRARLAAGLSFACEGLPELSIEHLFRSLAADPEFVAQAGECSFALVGFGVGPTDIASMARAAGLREIGACADDLHEAAHWRNNRAQYPRTIALARGYNAGVHTLGHYLKPEAGELARMLLLEAAQTLPERHPGSPAVHRELLKALANGDGTGPLRSVESVAGFLAGWDQLRPVHGNEAPVLALPELGLLEDRELFSGDDLGARLVLNLQYAERLRQLPQSDLRKAGARRFRDPRLQAEFAAAVAAVDAWLRASAAGRTARLNLSDVLLVLKPPKDRHPASPEPAPETEPDTDGDPPPEPPTDLVKHATEALLDGDEETLAAIADALEAAWDGLDPGNGEVEVAATLGDHRVIETTIRIDAKVVDWVGQFCTEDVFGGWFKTQETVLEQALAGAAEHQPVFVRADAITSIEGETLGLGRIFADWDQDVAKAINADTALADTWREFRALRKGLLPHLPKLIWHAREWLDGRPRVLEEVRRYLALAARLYRDTQAHYQVMDSGSPAWARAALEALLCLDIVQVRMVRPDGKERAAAVLLPTHPLHLWRTERLSTLLRGLAQSSPMDADERDTVRQELERPEQFLSVLRLPGMPEGRGLNQLLPYTNRIAGLAVFENLHNACSGADGVKALGNALDQFVIQYPNRPFPLRVAVVNPPAGGTLAVECARLLNDPRYRGGQRLSAIDLDLYATARHADRLRDSLRFGRTQEEDKVQEKVAAGRLSLCIQDDAAPAAATLEEIANDLLARPHHLVALFDESSIVLRRRTAGRVLPMSPFCVRYDVHLDQRSGRIELQPQPGESPFSEFLDLINAIEENQRDAVVQTYADAAGLAQTVDTLLQGERPAATWLLLADRALPPEAGMRSVRIWERREGLRDTFLAARDFNHLARLLAPVFHRVNLAPDPAAMADLLHQGARLLGDGLLALINKRDGKLDTNKAIGLVGLLFAARELLRRHPGALVLSVDHPLAQLWLRTGKRGAETRCDLLVLWRDPADGVLELTAVEVKTSDAGELQDAAARKQKGRVQICHTLEAIADALAGVDTAPPSPLSVPRCEMLKQTLARAASGRSQEPAQDRGNRLRWGAWLRELFHERQAPPRLRGCLMTVLLRRAGATTTEDLPPCGAGPMTHLVIGLREISALLAAPERTPAVMPAPDAGPPPDAGPATPPDNTDTGGNRETQAVPPGRTTPAPEPWLRTPAPPAALALSPAVQRADPGEPTAADAAALTWPPALNALGADRPGRGRAAADRTGGVCPGHRPALSGQAAGRARRGRQEHHRPQDRRLAGA